jgi:hypothetical protein
LLFEFPGPFTSKCRPGALAFAALIDRPGADGIAPGKSCAGFC